MPNLLDRLKKNSYVEEADVLAESKFFIEKDLIPTPVPMINVALSGDIDGGLGIGHTMLAGPSKHFKTSFALLMAKSWMDANPDGILMFYDTEFGSPQSYFEAFGIDLTRVLHVPVTNIEELKFDLVKQLNDLEKGDNVMVVIDSIGNVASKKEVADALDQSSKADMTRAKQLKSLFRMITPYLSIKKIPLVTVNHIYMEQGMFPKAIVSGGTGAYYSADNIWIIGRRQEKDGTEITGYHFVIRIEKSRFVREGSKIPISVSFEGGIERWSGLLEIGEELGFITKPKRGWYMPVDDQKNPLLSSNCRKAEFDREAMWKGIFSKTSFKDAIVDRFKIAHAAMIEGSEDAEEDAEE